VACGTPWLALRTTTAEEPDRDENDQNQAEGAAQSSPAIRGKRRALLARRFSCARLYPDGKYAKAGGPRFVTGKPVSGAQLGKGKCNLRTGACSAVVAVVAS
jgi:hypothetical protein